LKRRGDRAPDPDQPVGNDRMAEGRAAERVFLLVVGAVVAAEIAALLAWLTR
jgi:hypothetical protein